MTMGKGILCNPLASDWQVCSYKVPFSAIIQPGWKWTRALWVIPLFLLMQGQTTLIVVSC